MAHLMEEIYINNQNFHLAYHFTRWKPRNLIQRRVQKARSYDSPGLKIHHKAGIHFEDLALLVSPLLVLFSALRRMR